MAAGRSLLVYEFITAGGMQGPADAADAGLRAQGAAMRNAMLADLVAIAGLRVGCAVTAADELPASAAAVARHEPAPGETPEDFLRRVAPAFDRVWVVAPECGGVLGRLHAAVGAQRWLGADSDAIRVASSKRATRRRLAAFGVTVPCDGDSPTSPHTAWVVKPDDGAGAQQVRLHGEMTEAWRDFAARLGRGQTSTLEAWVEGTPMSLSVLSDGRAVEVLSVNRQAIDVDATGQVHYRGVAHSGSAADSELSELARHVQRAIPGLSGYWGIDLVFREHRPPVVIEVNPRLTCAYVGLSARLGRNLAAEMLARRRRKPSTVVRGRPETGFVDG
ncbi:MAG: ATP-grasp domain-containing protein [Rhodocyclaceae bacterium]|nr:ATP-grasp domain-containing protein [Rhodocyclaceae bacterium]